MSLLYRPEDGVAADFIPFWWRGRYHLFYLKDYRDPARRGPGTPWHQITTQDCARFEDWGEALPRGSADAQDAWCFTGSVIEQGGRFHIFYTGNNPAMAQQGCPRQAILHAMSCDLRTWEKDGAFRILPAAEYRQQDWRDPFVFWNADAGEYWMLLTARLPGEIRRHRGCITVAASRDLVAWEMRGPLWQPEQYDVMECPDLFRNGEWWYLVFFASEPQGDITAYRMSRELRGPWLAPEDDTLGGVGFCAAKTAGDGRRRFAFGWLPTRAGQRDEGAWEWGGNLVVHEIVPQPAGTLGVRPPPALVARFEERAPLMPQRLLGEWRMAPDGFESLSAGRFSVLLLGRMPRTCLIELKVRPHGPPPRNLGVLLRANETLEQFYRLRLEPASRRIVLDRFPRQQWPFMAERPLKISPDQEIALRVIVDETCLVVYANDQVALHGRMYDFVEGSWGLFVSEGQASFEGVRISTVAAGAGG